jgi:structure-specific recognition protein 1
MGAAAARTFDLKIVTKSGPEHNFTSINKEDHELVETYLKDKKIRVKNEMIPDADLLLAAAAGDDDDDDDDMQSVSSDDGPPRVKPSRGQDDDEDSEEDGKLNLVFFHGLLIAYIACRGLQSIRIGLGLAERQRL